MTFPNFPLVIGGGTAKGFSHVESVLGTDPAANTELLDTVPDGTVWLLLSYAVTLVQGATQTPQPTLVIDDGTHVVYQGVMASTAQNASVTCRYFAAPGLTLSAGTANTVAYSPIPSGLLLPAGSRIGTSTAGKGANSNYGAPSILVIEIGTAS